ncbi:Photosystem II reaction center Psb28 protein [Dionaea muscipula]
MAALQSIACPSPVSLHPQQHRPYPGIVSASVSRQWHVCSSFNVSLIGRQLHLGHAGRASNRSCSRTYAPITMMVKPKIQFIQGTDELSIPDVRLTKSRDGTNGVATFRFEQPSVFDSSSELGEITGFYMIDEEGVIQSVDVNAKFVNGKPAAIEAKYIMRNPREWDRFMRFMERYSNANDLQFFKK